MTAARQLAIPASLTGTSGIIIWSLVLLGLIVAGLAIALQVKKKITEVDPSSSSAGGFTLSDLRQMVKEGTLTPEEFEKAKMKIVAAAQRASERSGNNPVGDGRGPPRI